VELSATDRRLLAELERGLPLVPRPYALLGARVGLPEAEVMARLRRLRDGGVVRRFGLVVRHRRLGYRANAMVVWDVPEVRVRAAGLRLAALPFVTLCYRRRRHPAWPYNLYCMIHGRVRAAVEERIEEASRLAGLRSCPRRVLFSRRCFKQTGARYFSAPGAPAHAGPGP